MVCFSKHTVAAAAGVVVLTAVSNNYGADAVILKKPTQKADLSLVLDKKISKLGLLDRMDSIKKYYKKKTPEAQAAGCFGDAGDEKRWGTRTESGDGGVESCSKACADTTYFALQFHGECWCSNKEPGEGDYPKKDDAECGGDGLGLAWTNMVYQMVEPAEEIEHVQASYNCQNDMDPCCIDGTQNCAEEYKKPKSWGATLENPENLGKYLDDVEFVGELFYSIGCARQIDSAQNMEQGIKEAKKMAAKGASEEEIAAKIADRQSADESYMKEKGALMWVEECKKLNAIHLERCPRELCMETWGKKSPLPDYEQCKKECELKYTDLDGHCSKQGVELAEILGGRSSGAAKKTKCIDEHCPGVGAELMAAAKDGEEADYPAAKAKICDARKKAVEADASLDDAGKERGLKIVEKDCSGCDDNMLKVCVNDATEKTTEKTVFDFCRDVYKTWQEYELLDESGQFQR